MPAQPSRQGPVTNNLSPGIPCLNQDSLDERIIRIAVIRALGQMPAQSSRQGPVTNNLSPGIPCLNQDSLDERIIRIAVVGYLPRKSAYWYCGHSGMLPSADTLTMDPGRMSWVLSFRAPTALLPHERQEEILANRGKRCGCDRGRRCRCDRVAEGQFYSRQVVLGNARQRVGNTTAQAVAGQGQRT